MQKKEKNVEVEMISQWRKAEDKISTRNKAALIGTKLVNPYNGNDKMNH